MEEVENYFDAVVKVTSERASTSSLDKNEFS